MCRTAPSGMKTPAAACHSKVSFVCAALRWPCCDLYSSEAKRCSPGVSSSPGAVDARESARLIWSRSPDIQRLTRGCFACALHHGVIPCALTLSQSSAALGSRYLTAQAAAVFDAKTAFLGSTCVATNQYAGTVADRLTLARYMKPSWPLAHDVRRGADDPKPPPSTRALVGRVNGRERLRKNWSR